MSPSITYSFIADNNDHIDLLIPHSTINELSTCENIPGIYHTHDGLAFPSMNEHDCIEGQLEDFKDSLQECLKGEREIDRTTFFNIGYQWNEFLYDIQAKIPWHGRKYLCFSTAYHTETFIYTEKQQIIIELTHNYPWIFREPPAHTQIISFKEFLQTYKPCVYSTISHQTAERWIGQIDALLAIIAYNESSNLSE